MKTVFLLILIAAIAAGGVMLYPKWSAKTDAAFRTEPIRRGDLLVTIGATGTVEPEELVDVGAQVAGRIESLGKDPSGINKTVDYGSAVEEGTVLAHIDDSLYLAEVEQAGALLEQAKANVRRSEADLDQLKARFNQAARNWTRAQELGSSRALSATDFDSYQANFETGKAAVVVGEAAMLQAQKGVAQAEASLRRAKTNHGYCTIKSPVKGVIIDRRVNIGQTVVASLNAPSLFLIAKDLRKLQVWASVNEADIGHISPGQPVTFTVDAYAGRTFAGKVGKIRLNASMTQNVVCYTVEINTDNSDGKLLPYLTANVQFELARRKDILLVPNAAVRWTPPTEHIAPDVREKFAKTAPGKSPTSRPARGRGEPQSQPGTGSRGKLWAADGAFVRPVMVRLGMTDGAMTEIEGEGLKEGSEIVVGEAARNVSQGTTSPFTPQLFGGGRRG